MARSLREAGESVLPLLLLDPPDHPSQGSYFQLTEERFIDKMKARAAMGGTVGRAEDPAYMNAVVRTVTAFEHAIANHRPRPYDGPVYMLSSRQRLDGPDPAYLRNIFTGKVKRFEVATTHAQVLDPRNPEFASYLARCLGLIRGAVKESLPAVAQDVHRALR
jgi:thioesterase domain-containing protein